MLVVIPIFTWQDLLRMAHDMKKRWLQKTVKKEVKKVADELITAITREPEAVDSEAGRELDA